MKRMLTLLLVTLLVAAPASAAARPGGLDRSFGHRGKVVDVLGKPAPLAEEGPPLQLANISGGGFVALAGDTLVEHRRNGRRNRAFGTDGRLKVEAPAGTTLELSGLAVDSHGRILVAGTTREEGLRASAFVARYLRRGRLDRSFGEDGIVVSDLGLPTPPPPPNRGISPTPASTATPASTGPVVRVLGLALDGGDQPILTGSWLSDYQFCYPFLTDTPRETGYVARLRVDGSIDPSFGGDGVVVPDPAKETVTSPVAAGGGVLSAGAVVFCLRGGPEKPELTRVGKSGGIDTRFGSDGHVGLAFATPPAMSRDRFGRILVLGSTESIWPTLLRLTPTGKPELSFGHSGAVGLPAIGANEALATDYRGRAILAGSDSLVLMVDRRKNDGSVDRGFGRGGEVETLFPGELELHHHEILVGGGKILVGGTWVAGDRYGIAFARYLGH